MINHDAEVATHRATGWHPPQAQPRVPAGVAQRTRGAERGGVAVLSSVRYCRPSLPFKDGGTRGTRRLTRKNSGGWLAIVCCMVAGV